MILIAFGGPSNSGGTRRKGLKIGSILDPTVDMFESGVVPVIAFSFSIKTVCKNGDTGHP